MNQALAVVEHTAGRLEPVDLELTRLQALQHVLLDLVREARRGPDTAAAFVSFLSAVADHEASR